MSRPQPKPKPAKAPEPFTSARATAAAIIRTLRSKRNPRNIKGMVRFGISPKGTLGVPIPILRRIARAHRRDHALALELWKSGIHEARILATMVDDPAQATEKQLDAWTKDFDSWDTCDQACSNLFSRTPHAWNKVRQWAENKDEFVRRAAFALIAAITVHDKAAPDSKFIALLPLIKKYSTDDRNFVRKAVNWALRQIGKRNARLRAAALRTARQIQAQDSKAAKWIAADAIRELEAKAAAEAKV